jgi:RimJ/RimL family protein N-acetyltransferase
MDDKNLCTRKGIQLRYRTSTSVSDKNNSVSGPVIGVLGMTVDSKTSFATIGYCLSPEHWGRGYLTDAPSAFMSSYWDTHPNGLPGNKYEGKGGRSFVEAVVESRNMASVRVLEKSGFELVREEEVEDWYGGRKVLLKTYRVWKPEG